MNEPISTQTKRGGNFTNSERKTIFVQGIKKSGIKHAERITQQHRFLIFNV